MKTWEKSTVDLHRGQCGIMKWGAPSLGLALETKQTSAAAVHPPLFDMDHYTRTELKVNRCLPMCEVWYNGVGCHVPGLRMLDESDVRSRRPSRV